MLCPSATAPSPCASSSPPNPARTQPAHLKTTPTGEVLIGDIWENELTSKWRYLGAVSGPSWSRPSCKTDQSRRGVLTDPHEDAGRPGAREISASPVRQLSFEKWRPSFFCIHLGRPPPSLPPFLLPSLECQNDGNEAELGSCPQERETPPARDSRGHRGWPGAALTPRVRAARGCPWRSPLEVALGPLLWCFPLQAGAYRPPVVWIGSWSRLGCAAALGIGLRADQSRDRPMG
eukprot:8795955-Pyramimonas_sp.AAC.1